MKRNSQQINWQQKFSQLSEIESAKAYAAAEKLHLAFIKTFALIDDESFSKEYRKFFGDWLVNVAKIAVRENLELLKEWHDT